jgi:hypothetical protein
MENQSFEYAQANYIDGFYFEGKQVLSNKDDVGLMLDNCTYCPLV